MDGQELIRLFESVANGQVSAKSAASRFSEDVIRLPFARLDGLRDVRCGFPEVVFAEGKTEAQVQAIVQRLASGEAPFLVTRANAAQAAAVLEVVPGAVYRPEARLVFRGETTPRREGLVGVLSAGTVDIPVAEEAALTAELMGARVERIFDVGVAGLHRLADAAPLLRTAEVLIVVAGMEGALPGVVAGLTDRPVIGVPTSTGYGAALHGIAALLTMVNACAPGLTVVNIDNGFGAGYAAALVNRRTLGSGRSNDSQEEKDSHANG